MLKLIFIAFIIVTALALLFGFNDCQTITDGLGNQFRRCSGLSALLYQVLA
ncbi:hypothetical protein J4N42_06355 [Vibrio sp. SCSIO 43135]|uniref:hypothetical protein n=1 Tax=Vibrio sp. SCSIO 43135 TaxID=2819096 RepID=UPI0020755A9B|nr:hypothetical protein [Vibrio sp. SCSIO 43135]USD42337.1 hypothetical protein J4N42_06355 [Vibrio sp. SCSIO 43135]